jgi:hypothetical protein
MVPTSSPSRNSRQLSPRERLRPCRSKYLAIQSAQLYIVFKIYLVTDVTRGVFELLKGAVALGKHEGSKSWTLLYSKS